jgi:hypothetical protein
MIIIPNISKFKKLYTSLYIAIIIQAPLSMTPPAAHCGWPRALGSAGAGRCLSHGTVWGNATRKRLLYRWFINHVQLKL